MHAWGQAQRRWGMVVDRRLVDSVAPPRGAELASAKASRARSMAGLHMCAHEQAAQRTLAARLALGSAARLDARYAALRGHGRTPARQTHVAPSAHPPRSLARSSKPASLLVVRPLGRPRSSSEICSGRAIPAHTPRPRRGADRPSDLAPRLPYPPTHLPIDPLHSSAPRPCPCALPHVHSAHACIPPNCARHAIMASNQHAQAQEAISRVPCNASKSSGLLVPMTRPRGLRGSTTRRWDPQSSTESHGDLRRSTDSANRRALGESTRPRSTRGQPAQAFLVFATTSATSAPAPRHHAETPCFRWPRMGFRAGSPRHGS